MPGVRTRGRGHPQGLTREMIVSAAEDILRRDPRRAPSINRIARHLGVTPMAIYNHVENRDHLMRCLAGRLFENFHPALPRNDWRDALRRWARALRAYFHDHPEMLQLLSWQQHTAPGYLEQMAQLLELLPPEIGPDARRLLVVQWFMQSVLGFVCFELEDEVRDYGLSDEDLAGGSDRLVRNLTPLLPELKDYQPRHLFDLNVECALTAIAAMSAPAKDPEKEVSRDQQC